MAEEFNMRLLSSSGALTYRHKSIIYLLVAILLLHILYKALAKIHPDGQLSFMSIFSNNSRHNSSPGDGPLVGYSLANQHLTIYPLDGSAGRLGNFCFRYAAARGMAHRNNKSLYLPDTQLVQYMIKAFSITTPTSTDLPYHKQLKFSNISERHWGVYDPSFNMLPRGNVRLKWVYSQSWKYFYPIRKQIRQELQLNRQLMTKANHFMDNLKLRFNSSVTVGLHVRRGDFLRVNFQNWGYSVAPAGYFARAIKWYTARYGKNIIFIVSSDDIEWCKKNIDFNGAKYYISDGKQPLEDFSLLIACDHHIISVGSFGWWAAWLGRGDVVYYKNFPAPGSNHSRNHNPADYYHPGWIPLV